MHTHQCVCKMTRAPVKPKNKYGPGTSSVFDGDFPQRFVQLIVHQENILWLDAIFTRWKQIKESYFHQLY